METTLENYGKGKVYFGENQTVEDLVKEIEYYEKEMFKLALRNYEEDIVLQKRLNFRNKTKKFVDWFRFTVITLTFIILITQIF